MPKEWEKAFDARLAPLGHAVVEERLRFLVGKYWEHGATPSKFDGLACDAFTPNGKYKNPHTHEGDDCYDCDAYYGEDGSPDTTLAELAEGVIYQQLRTTLMQQIFDEYAAAHGTKPVRVITPDQLLEELGPPDTQGSEATQLPSSEPPKNGSGRLN